MILPVPSYAGLIENIFSKGKSWDVIVVGAGAAGLSAAVEAADNGASVLLLESQPEIGGNTLISGGFYASVDILRLVFSGRLSRCVAWAAFRLSGEGVVCRWWVFIGCLWRWCRGLGVFCGLLGLPRGV